MRPLRPFLIGIILTAGLSCGGSSDRKASANDSTADSSSAHLRVSWFPNAAQLLLVPGRAPDRALVALADTTLDDPAGSLADSNGVFFGLDGRRVSSRVTITQSMEGCVEAALEPSPSSQWGVGFIGGAPSALVVDSLRGMSRQDSTTLTRAAFRVASTVPNDPAGRFAGLPFVLVDLWRFAPAGSTGVTLIATLRRQINQEDSPLQERTFVIAESANASSPDSFTLAFSERSSGAEETVESRELLAAVRFPGSNADLIIGHDFGGQTSYSILERSADGKWSARWSSRRVSC